MDIPILLLGLTAVLVCVILILAIFILKTAIGNGKSIQSTAAELESLEKRFSDKSTRTGEPWSVIYAGVSPNVLGNQRLSAGMYSYVAQRLLDLAREQDEGTVIHADGKSFVLVNHMNGEGLEQLVKQLKADLRRYVSEHHSSHFLEVRFGRYIVRDEKVTFQMALEHARQAFWYAEKTGKRICVYDYTQQYESEIMEKLVVNAIRDKAFYMQLQPFVDARTGQMVGCEILTRLKHPSGGLVIPKQFLDIIAKNELFTEFDYCVFERSCAWLAGRSEKCMRGKVLSCNFSRCTVSQPDFVKKIQYIAEQYGIDYSMTAVEVTEEDVESDSGRMLANLHRLRELGFQVYFDDFGTGYTSLADIQTYPIDVLKLDISILKNAATEKGRVIFENIVSMAKGLGIKVLCEGVETAEQAQLVADSGCDVAQGFYYYTPLDVQDCNRLFARESA